MESFHGGQLRDLNKSAKWKQLGIEAAILPSLAPLHLSPCLSLCLQEKSARRRVLTTGLTIGLTLASSGQLVAEAYKLLEWLHT